jgi:hypothetical protein
MAGSRAEQCVKCHQHTLCKAYHEDPKTGDRLGPFCPKCRPRTSENYTLHLYDPTQFCETKCEGCVFTNPPKAKEFVP